MKNDTPHWHAIYTASRSEKKVRDRLNEQGIENFVPIQTVVRQWKYRKQKVDVPVISGMLFVRVTRQEQIRVLETRGVVCYLRLRCESQPAVIPDKQIEDFRFLIDYSDSAVEMINDTLEIGDKIRVIKGSLSGMEGELIRYGGESKVVVRLSVLGYAAVTIPGSFVETIDSL